QAQVLHVGDRVRVKDETWSVDGAMCRTIIGQIVQPGTRTQLLELVREGEGDKARWKFNIPVTEGLRKSVDHLKQTASNYVRPIDKVKYAIKKDAATKSDLLRELRTELQEAK